MSILFINSITDNNIVSSAEAQTGFNITGGGQPGATVRLTFDSGRELAGGNTTVVNQNGQWSVPVVAGDVKAFGQGMERVTAFQILDNTSLQTFRTFTVDAIFIDDPVIDVITDTAIIDAAATATSLTVTGTGKPGATLILGFTSGLTLTGNSTTIVREDGTWSVDIAVADIFIFAQGGEVLTATQIDRQSISLPTTQPLVNQSGFTRIFDTDGDDELFAPSTGNAQVFGLEGNDILDATPNLSGQVILYGGPGNDTLIGGNNHTLYGGDGDDNLLAAGSLGRNILYGGPGNDLLIVVEGSHNQLYGGAGNDRLIVSDGGGFNRLYGEEGNNILDASSGTGNNQLFGGVGNDILIAGAATDELFGGAGNDQLFAANGGILTGGSGANTFYLANSSIPSQLTIITDFKPGGDRLVVAGLPALTAVKLIEENADTIVIALLSDTELPLALLQGIQPTALVAGRDVFSQTESLLEPINLVIRETFQVTSFEQNPSGFVLTFNDDLNLSVLNLYRGLDLANPLAPVTDLPDLILTDSAGNIINGSLIWDQGNANTLTFVKTGDILAPGNYTLTLESRRDGFVTTNGRLLDGNEDGFSGGNFVREFTVNSPTVPVLTLPDFSRAPGQEVNRPAGGGQFAPLPIRITNPGGVDNISFTLQYDPDLLVVRGANVVASGWNFTSNPTIDPLTGRAEFTLSGSALNASTDLITLDARVPGTATYGAKGVLQILPGAGLVGDSAVQLVALVGDTTKTQEYLAVDASLISRVNVGLDTGFRAFPVTDPLIIGDATGDGRLDAGDTTSVRRAAVGLSSPFLPPLV
ncbi:calcium-binding protein [Anabaena sp. CS-542/02]|uniref:calcium-binding protein n=1 Tax=Anabaena sp. CS-542/02 TaxID=3021719 RepID=UPI00232F4BFA|nr:calcium-binding protein [Anabaena sp. CS-542/02]MDB9448078.1 calcium-binding protein [Anabaena sp. CS-542/02]